ncbi:MAG: hypothetical protein K1060chlam5_01179 [Candidatus Anoxychlamydiales bacterium]|nr:hypothetical protein [Candidatus Anoxychlamydiales bacterium]
MTLSNTSKMIEMQTYLPGYFDSINKLDKSQQELTDKIKTLYEKFEIKEKNEQIKFLLDEYFSSLNTLKNKFGIYKKVECFDIGFYLYQAFRAQNKEIFINTHPNYYSTKILPLALKYIESFNALNDYLNGRDLFQKKIIKSTLIEKINELIKDHNLFMYAVVKGFNDHHRKISLT